MQFMLGMPVKKLDYHKPISWLP